MTSERPAAAECSTQTAGKTVTDWLRARGVPVRVIDLSPIAAHHPQPSPLNPFLTSSPRGNDGVQEH